MNAVELAGVSFSYDKTKILDDVTFQVEDGCIFCLLGPNGCGKTTLQRCILGLHKPQSGSIRVQGKPILAYRPRELAKTVSYVPQFHEKTFPYRTVDVVLMGRSHAHERLSTPGSEDEALAMEALETVGMAAFAERRYTELSGGELQLVMIARAICQDTAVMLLDEPASHLDFKNELTLLEILTKLAQKSKMTLIIASHSLNHPLYFESEGIPTKIALMEKGAIRKIGKPQDVCSTETMRQVFGIETRLRQFSESGKDRYFMLSWKSPGNP